MHKVILYYELNTSNSFQPLTTVDLSIGSIHSCVLVPYTQVAQRFGMNLALKEGNIQGIFCKVFI